MDNEIDHMVVLPQEWTALAAAMTHNDPISEDLESVARKLIVNGEAQLVLLDDQINGLERTPQELFEAQQNKSNHFSQRLAKVVPRRKQPTKPLFSLFEHNLDHINRLEHRLPDLLESRRTKADHLHQYHVVTAPHRKLPLELLAENFEHIVECIGFPYRSNESIFTLILVCRKWKQVVLHTGPLWSNIYINYDSVSWRDFSRVNKLLSMSGDLPLTIELMNYPPAGKALEIPRLYPQRCKDLVIEGHSVAIQDLFRPHSGSLSSLQCLSIRVDERTMSQASLPFLKTAVNLRKLKLAMPSGHHSGEVLNQLQLSNLTYLDTSSASMNPEIILAAMSRCPSLTICMVSFSLESFSDMERPRAEPMIILPSLKRISIGLTRSFLYYSMKGVVMSNLVHLTFSGPDLPDDFTL